MARGRKAGFTLVELLVVIGIIALLAALLLPVLAAATGSARSARCRSKLQQYYQGLRMYLNNNEEFFPTAWLLDSAGSTDLSGLSFHRFMIHEYCETNFKHTYNAATDTEDIPTKFKRDQLFWEGPGAGWTKDYFAPTMVFRGPMTGNDLNLAATPPFDGNSQYTEITKDVASTERPILTECDASFAQGTSKTDSSATNTSHTAELQGGWTAALASFSAAGNVAPSDPNKVFVGVGTSSRSISSGANGELVADDNQSRFDSRHNGSNNFLFADGHVESVSITNKDRRNRIHERWNNIVPAPGK